MPSSRSGASGSAALQAAARRGANQAIDKAPLDLSLARMTADGATQRTRLGEDQATSTSALARARTRLGEDSADANGALDLEFGADGRRAQDPHPVDGLGPEHRVAVGRGLRGRTVR